MIDTVSDETGFSKTCVSEILNGIRNVVLEKFGNSYDCVEIKLFPGLKISSKYISSKDSKLSLCKSGNIKSDTLLYLNSDFSKNFKNEIYDIHRKYE